MKAIAIILVIVCLAAFAGVGYMYMKAVVEVDTVDLIVYEAGTQEALFQDLKEQVAEHRLIGTMFSDSVPEQNNDLAFLQYTVTLKNDTFLKAEEAEIQITPVAEDILQIGETMPVDIPAHEKGNVQAILLTSKDTKTIRELTVTYYIWGLPFTIRTTYGSAAAS